MRKIVISTLMVAFLIPAGCQSKAGNGALIGGAVGALAGGVIGNQSHGRGTGGAIIGGVVGAGAGALIGHSMDQEDKKNNEKRYTSDYDKNFDSSGNRVR